MFQVKKDMKKISDTTNVAANNNNADNKKKDHFDEITWWSIVPTGFEDLT